MNHPKIWPLVILFLLFIVLTSGANAQSKDQDNPTHLTQEVISDTLGPDKNGETYYYSFMAGPGDITLTLAVEGGPPVGGKINGVIQAGFAIFDENEVQLTRKFATTYGGNISQAVEKVYLRRRERVVLSLILENNTGTGKYRLRIGGAIELAGGISGLDPSTQTTLNPSKNKINNSECLPKQGTLIIKMKDGSKKIVDLSEADTITIVP